MGRAASRRRKSRLLSPIRSGSTFTLLEELLLELLPHTGRMHQLRIQSASRGWPIRGDALYGAKTPFGPPAELPRDQLIALHAYQLTFLHPISYEPITLTAEVPRTWRGRFAYLLPRPA